MKNLPNIITFTRLILSIPFCYFFSKGYDEIAIIIYTFCSLTDYLDGYIARKNNLISDLGIIADPLADKMMYISALLIFIERGYISALAPILITFRELTVLGLRLVCYINGKIFSSGIKGKVKSVFQVLSFYLILLFKYNIYSSFIIYFIALITLYSAYDYLKEMIKFLREKNYE